MANSLTKQNTGTSASKQTFSSFMSAPAIQKKVNEIVQGKDGQRFITALVSAVSTNAKLAECDHFSIFTGALLGESLKLSPSPQLGQYYLVPYKNKGVSTAQFQLGYKGYIQLAIRSGQYKRIHVMAIKEGELINYNPLTEELEVNLIQNDTEREKSKTIGYYANIELMNGFSKSLYWSYEKMLNHADKYSKAFNSSDYARLLAGKIDEKDLWKYSSFWYKDFDAMAYKTLLRQIISKWGIMSIDIQTAMTNDMAVIGEDGTADYVDNSASDISGFIPQAEASIDEINNRLDMEIMEAEKEQASLLDGVDD